MAFQPRSNHFLCSVAQLSLLGATMGIFSGCIVDDRPHRHDRVTVIEHGAPPPPPPPPVVEVHRRPSPHVEVVVETETPPPPPRFVIVERNGPPPPAHVVVVPGPPPPRRQEVQGLRPSPSYVWLDGHYRYSRGSYIWTPGHWEVPPRAHARYIAPHWERRNEGQVFIEGYWKL